MKLKTEKIVELQRVKPQNRKQRRQQERERKKRNSPLQNPALRL